MTSSVTSVILSADYFCLESYVYSDGHFLEIYLDCLVTALNRLLNVVHCRMTALDCDCLY